MSEISSISFSEISIDKSQESSQFTHIQLDELLEKLGSTLYQVKQMNGVSVDILSKLTELVKQSQHKLHTEKERNLEAHKKCLQHIEMLLYQKDYAEALSKIDYYKKIQLNDLSFQADIFTTRTCQENGVYSFEQAKAIIASDFADFALKEQVWLEYALPKQQNEEELNHVTHEQIQEAIFENFKRQFQIQQQITEIGEIRAHNIVSTPQKKNSKSISNLKSSAKNNNKSTNLIVKSSKSNEKSAGKLTNPGIRSSQKRTCRKNGTKIAHQNVTAKKTNPPSAFVV